MIWQKLLAIGVGSSVKDLGELHHLSSIIPKLLNTETAVYQSYVPRSLQGYVVMQHCSIRAHCVLYQINQPLMLDARCHLCIQLSCYPLLD